MTRNESQLTGPAEEEKGSQGKTGIGTLFRKEREKKGLSHAEVSEMTRLRPYVLAALEDEAWEQLPAPVFVRGFIRSFARVLGMEEENIVALYRELATEDLSPPKPLLEPARGRKTFLIILIFLLLAMAFAYYFWKELSTREQLPPRPESISSEVVNTKKAEAGLSAPRETGPSELIKEEKPSQELALPFLSFEPEPAGPQTVSEAQLPGLTLKAHVMERTWIKIFVDDHSPKEYIFRPGSTPEWNAQKGFDLLVGNATGVAFEFNGKRIENLGRRGQVVRLRLPEGYERSDSEE